MSSLALPSPEVCIFLRRLTRADMMEYIDTYFKAPRMVLAAAGGRYLSNL